MTVLDGRQIAAGRILHGDVCILGAGAAGIALAQELVSRGLSVLLVESGGFEEDARTQSLYDGVATGTVMPDRNSYLLRSRIRRLGGTTNGWGGWCRPLDPQDFESRPWVPHSGWPISRDDLWSYYERAARVLDIAPFDREETHPAELPIVLPRSESVRTVRFHLSTTNMRKKYGDLLRNHEKISLVTHANAIRLHVDPAYRSVITVAVRALGGSGFYARGRRFVVAMGGIESTRLLLHSQAGGGRSCLNGSGLLGMFFQDHPHIAAGAATLVIPRDLETYEYHRDRPDASHRFVGVLTLDPTVRKQERLLNARVVLDRVESSSELGELETFDKLLEVPPGFEIGRFHINASCECAPCAASRLELDDITDELGVPRVRLRWRIHDADLASVRRTLEILLRELGRYQAGRIRIADFDGPPYPGIWGGHHHMGTIRMSADPGEGLVDARCMSHGTRYLYIASSAVFPTYGYANPTLTIVALALRIADHLVEEIHD